MKLLVVVQRLREQVSAASEYSVAGELVGYALRGYGGVQLHDASVWSHHLHHLVIRSSLTCANPFERTVPHWCGLGTER